jgi:hypothetical protein
MTERDARIQHLIQTALAAKAERRRDLARLAIEDKVRVVVELQRLATETTRAIGRPAREPWVVQGASRPEGRSGAGHDS